MIIACDAQGDSYLSSLGLDIGTLLTHRSEPWAIVATMDEGLIVRFAHTPEEAAGLAAAWMRADIGAHPPGFALEESVLAALKALHARVQH